MRRFSFQVAPIVGPVLNIAFCFHSCRCIVFLYYYPAQPVPLGYCGVGYCDGTIDNAVALEDDSDLDRSYGIIHASCSEALEEVVLSFHYFHFAVLLAVGWGVRMFSLATVLLVFFRAFYRFGYMEFHRVSNMIVLMDYSFSSMLCILLGTTGVISVRR